MIWWQWHLTTDPIIVHTTNPISNIVHLSRILHQQRNNSLIMFLHSSCVISWGIIPTNTMCQEISHISFTLYQLEQTIICVPIIYILSCSAKTRHTMDIIIMIIQRVHIYFVLCILSYKLQLRADIMTDISLTNSTREETSEMSHSTTFIIMDLIYPSSTTIKVSQPTNYKRIHHLLHIQDGICREL